MPHFNCCSCRETFAGPLLPKGDDSTVRRNTGMVSVFGGAKSLKPTAVCFDVLARPIAWHIVWDGELLREASVYRPTIHSNTTAYVSC
jgi:hypothetical protein